MVCNSNKETGFLQKSLIFNGHVSRLCICTLYLRTIYQVICLESLHDAITGFLKSHDGVTMPSK